MDRRIILWAVIGILFLAVLFLTFKVATLSSGETGKIDMTGWTDNEIMNYEMHGTIPARVKGSSAPAGSSSGMVGGC